MNYRMFCFHLANTILAVLNIDRDLIDDNLGNINSTGKYEITLLL